MLNPFGARRPACSGRAIEGLSPAANCSCSGDWDSVEEEVSVRREPGREPEVRRGRFEEGDSLTALD